METETKKKLALPAVLAVAVLATGCVTTVSTTDASPQIADAGTDVGFDAGCIPPEEYDPISHSCVPIV